MIKQIKISIYMGLCAVCGLYAPTSAQAFIIPVPALPFAPTFDPSNNVMHFLHEKDSAGIMKNLTKLKGTLNNVVSVKGMGLEYKSGTCLIGNCSANGLGSGETGKSVEASKDIEKTTLADIYDPDSVRNAFYKLFLVLPTSGLSDESCYREQGRKFFSDTALELYSSSKAVIDQLDLLEKDIANLEIALSEGSKTGDIEMDEPENTNTALENAYQSYDIYEQLLRLTQELKAMQMQYEAALAVQGNAAPIRRKEIKQLEKIDNADKNASLIINGTTYFEKSQLALAQLSSYEKDGYNFLKMKPAPDAPINNPFKGQEGAIEDLKEINSIGEKVYDALEVHSLISELPSYREIFESYYRFKKIHDKALESLNKADTCSINFLSKYYNNAEKVWEGDHLGGLKNQHEYRTGISKYLINTYDVAKAAMVVPVDEKDTGVGIKDSSIDARTAVSPAKAKGGSTSGSEHVLNPVKEKENMDLSRESSQLTWNIGSAVLRDAGISAKGQNKWGTTNNTYTLWADQKNFYDQYLNAKFDNIVKYLKRIDLRPTQIEAAREYNKDNKNKVVSDFDKTGREGGRKWVEDLARFEGTAALVQIGVPESEWVAPLNKKRSAMIPNHDELNKREKKLNEEKATLQTQRSNLAKQTQTNAVIKKIAEIDARIMEINRELTDIASNRNWLAGYDKELYGIVKTEEWTVATNKELLATQALEKKDFETRENNYKASLKNLSNAVSKVRNDRDNEIKGYESRLKTLSAEIETAQEKINLYNTSINIAEDAAIEVKEGFNSGAASSVNKKALQQKADEQKNLITRLSKEAKTLLAKIDERIKYYDGKIADAEREFSIKAADINANEPGADIMAPLNYLFDNKVAKTIASADKGLTSTLKNYFAHAVAISEELRPYSIDVAEKTREDILNIGDDLYLQSSNDDVNAKYRAFIDKLKNVDLNDLLSFSSVLRSTYNSHLKLIEVVRDVYGKYVINTICADDACYARDSEYFVGLMSKELDFQAPKEPINEYLPPLREVFYFDDVDYSGLYSKDKKTRVLVNSGSSIGSISIPVYSTHYYLSKDGILTYGGQMPLVWKLALSSNAFVEKDIDLKSFFGEEKVDDIKANFFRGGRYPCKLSDQSSVMIDVDKNANFIVTQLKGKNVPTCQEIEIENRGSYYRVTSKYSEEKANAGVGQPAPMEYGGELGQIFAFVNNYVVFRDESKTAFDRLVEIKKYQEEDKKYSSSIKDDIYDNASFKKNQLGDFLDFVEIERNYKQALDKMKVNLDETKEALFEQLRKAGFEPDENLNLAHEEDYNTVRNALKSKKAKIINEVAPMISKVGSSSNTLVKSRIENFENVYKAMAMDSEELIAIPSSNVNLSDVSETIKTEKANAKVKEEYKKEVEKAVEDELKKISAPYCASY